MAALMKLIVKTFVKSMYIIELFLKKWIEKKKKKPVFEYKEPEENLDEECENHNYMPVDSTKNYLACKNCGHVIKNSFRININPFIK